MNEKTMSVAKGKDTNEGKSESMPIFALLLAGGLGLMLAGCALAVVAWQRIPARLSYDGVHPYWVGGHRVTIETKSFSMEPPSGDEGPAQIIITSADGTRTVLDSSFNNDLFMDIRPAYVSWQGVDAHHGRDLLIWKSVARELLATDYISNGDGQHHTLNPPQTK